jgi:hypothetical protein
MSEYADIVEGASFRDGENGREAVRVFTLSGITGDPPARIARALERPIIPRRMDPHPTEPGIICLDLSARALDPTIVEVTATYGVPATQSLLPENEAARGVMEVGATVSAATTQKDVNGDAIMVTGRRFVHRDDPDGAGALLQSLGIVSGFRFEDQGGDVEIQIPMPAMRVSRIEPANPWRLARTYVGRVNARRWNDGEPRTWLCTAINGTTNDFGKTFEVSYEFQFNDETWDATVVYIDPDTGQPTSEAIELLRRGIPAIRTVQVYRTIDFDPLGLRFQ